MTDFSQFMKGPLTDEHLKQINDALAAGVEARKQINLAQRAGIDVTAQLKALDDTEAKLKNIKNVYFPGR